MHVSYGVETSTTEQDDFRFGRCSCHLRECGFSEERTVIWREIISNYRRVFILILSPLETDAITILA